MKSILLMNDKNVLFLVSYLDNSLTDIYMTFRDNEKELKDEEKLEMYSTIDQVKSFVAHVQQNIRPTQDEKDFILVYVSSMTEKASGGTDTEGYKAIMTKVGLAFDIL